MRMFFRMALFLFIIIFINSIGCIEFGYVLGADPPEGANAQFLRCEVPANLVTDEVFRADIYMINTGTRIWGTGENQIQVTLVSKNPDFNSVWGTYFIIQGQHDTVEPGETFTFTSYLKAPSVPGDYTFSWQCQNWVPSGGSIPDLKQKAFFGEIVNGPTIHVTRRTETPPPPPPHQDGLLDISDFGYAGSFIPPNLAGQEDTYSESGLTLRKVNGSKHLILRTGTYNTRLYEIEIPPLVKIVDGDDSAVPKGTLVRDWGELGYGTIGGERIDANCGFWFDESTNILYWSHYNSYYCGGPSDFPQLMATTLNADGTKSNIGYWYIPGTPAKYKSYWGGVTKLSQSFANTYTGGRDLAVGFGGYYSICGSASRGPALGAIARPKGSGSALDLLEMMTYPDPVACPREGNYFSNVGYWATQPATPWQGEWTGIDRCRAGVFIDLPDRKGYIAFAHQGIGRLGYDYGGYNADGHYQSCWYFYDIHDLGAAAKGDISPTNVLPSSYNTVYYPVARGTVTGACFDEDTRMLYIYVQQGRNNFRPIIHVYHIAERPDRTPPTMPTNLSGQGIANTKIALTWNPSTDAGCLAGYHIYRNGYQVGTTNTAQFVDIDLTPATTYSYTVSAFDSAGNESAQSPAITATTLVNGAPSVSLTNPGKNLRLRAPADINMTANANDSDGGVTKVQFYNGNLLLGEDATSPYACQWSDVAAGDYTITAVAIDDSGLSTTSIPVHILVYLNQPPVITPIDNQTVDVGSSLNFTVTATDVDGEPLTYSASDLPARAVFDPSSHTFSWTPGHDQVGEHFVTFSVSDGQETVNQKVAVTVHDQSIQSRGLTGYYYDNANFTELRMIRNDPTIEFNWPGASPHPCMTPTTFTVRWTGKIVPLYSENYIFFVNSDDRARLWVDGKLIIDAWTSHTARIYRGAIRLQTGKNYNIRLDYCQNTGEGVVRMQWSSKSQTLQVVPVSQLYPRMVATPPTPPVNVKVDNIISSGMVLSWDANDAGTVKYRIYASRTSGFTPAAKYMVGEVTGSNFIHANLRANTGYYYRITAVDAANNESPKTAQISARTLPVTPPSNVRAGNITTSSLNLAWDDSDRNVVKYRVYASRTANFTPDGKTLKGEVTTPSFNWVNIKANATYYIRISAVDVAGNESAKTAFKALTLPVMPPSNVRADNITSSSLELAWEDNDVYVVKYEIYASQINGFTPDSKTLYGEVTEHSFRYMNLRANTSYYFRISAVDVTGNESAKTKLMMVRTN